MVERITSGEGCNNMGERRSNIERISFRVCTQVYSHRFMKRVCASKKGSGSLLGKQKPFLLESTL